MEDKQLPFDMCFYIENILKKDRLWKARVKIKDSKFIEFHVKIVKYLKQTNKTSLYRSLDCSDYCYELEPTTTTILYFKQEEFTVGHRLELKKLRTFNWNFLSIV